MSAELLTLHTADLNAGMKTSIRDLLVDVFPDIDDDAIGNALGGIHALLIEDGVLIGHASPGRPGSRS